jgi:three-Cys-motif partner protein
MKEEQNILNEPTSDWGGTWTEKKLDAFSKYVWSYLAIMKQNPFWKTIYFDGFAGSGTRKKDQKSELYLQLKLTKEEEEVYKGSAERIINTSINHQFDYYYFIDVNDQSLAKLERKLKALPNSDNKTLLFRDGNANKWILELSKALKTKKFAALIFLDPFGMQIDWKSIEALKDTRSDVWILVPTGVIVNRLLDKAGKLTHLEKLQSFFGLSEAEIRSKFYKKEQTITLFGEEEAIAKISKPIEQISQLYVERLKTIWTEVTEKPLVLKNSMNVPIFHFVFASNNKTATRIAKEIIKNI